MSPVFVGTTGLALLLAMLLVRVPVAFAMFAVGFAGIWILNGLPGSDRASGVRDILARVQFRADRRAAVHPDGQRRQYYRDEPSLYDAAYASIGQVRGGLASATVIGCGGFAALRARPSPRR